MKRMESTEHSVRCPLEDRTATLTARTDPDGYPSRRHLDVTACSLQPSTPFVPPSRSGFFTDMAWPVSYACEVESAPHHPEIACRKSCLAILNAAERGAAEAPRCTSGVGDSLELARQVERPAIVRLLWFHSA